MALQNFWGFENGVVPNGFEAHSVSGVPTLSIVDIGAASGKYCITVDNLASSPTRIAVPVKQNTADLFVGLNYKVSTLETSSEVLCCRMGESFISVSTKPDGSLDVQVRDQLWPSNRGMSLGQTKPSAVIVDRWVYLSFHIKAREATGLVDIHRNGFPFASYHRTNTGKNSSDRQLFVGGKPTNGYSFVDDLVVADSTGDAFDSMIAPVAIEAFNEKNPFAVKRGYRLTAASAIYDDSTKEIITSAKSLTEHAIRKLVRP